MSCQHHLFQLLLNTWQLQAVVEHQHVLVVAVVAVES
jgi:hypothetical protein